MSEPFMGVGPRQSKEAQSECNAFCGDRPAAWLIQATLSSPLPIPFFHPFFSTTFFVHSFIHFFIHFCHPFVSSPSNVVDPSHLVFPSSDPLFHQQAPWSIKTTLPIAMHFFIHYSLPLKLSTWDHLFLGGPPSNNHSRRINSILSCLTVIFFSACFLNFSPAYVRLFSG